MKNDDPIFITGMGRCGLTLMMTMLNSIGVRCYGEPPAFEQVRPGETIHAARFKGFAVKIVDPLLCHWPKKMQARVVMLMRTPLEQAKSQIKMVQWMAPSMAARFIVAESTVAMAESIGRDDIFAAKMFRDMGCNPLRLSFEQLLAFDSGAIDELALYLNLPPRYMDMRKCIVPRGPECQPGMDIELNLCGANP